MILHLEKRFSMLQYIFPGLQGNCVLLSCEFINYQVEFMHYRVSGQGCFTNNAMRWFSFTEKAFKYERLILQGNNREEWATDSHRVKSLLPLQRLLLNLLFSESITRS